MTAGDKSAATATVVPLPGARLGRDPERAIKRGPRRIPAEAVAATQRDRLYDGLVHTVAEKGYGSARVSDICQAAGVTRPAFYALFEGKDDAFLATYRHGIAVVVDMMERAYREADEWRDGAREALRVLLEVLASVPAFATMALVEIDAVGPAARREQDRVLRRFDQFFADAPAPEGCPDVDELVAGVVGGIYGVIQRHIAAGRVRQLPGLLPALTYFMMAPYLGPEQAGREAARAGEPTGATAAAPCRQPAAGRP